MNGKNLNSLTQMVNHLYFILLHLFQSSHYSALDLGSSKYNVSARVVRKEMLFENSYNMLKINYTFYILKKDDNNYNNKSLPFLLIFKDKQFLLLYSTYNDELIRYPLQYIQNIYLMEGGYI